MDSKSVMGYVQHYQRNIERAQDNEQKLLYCIGKLYKLPIQMEHLQETGIGKTVNALRKFEGEISVAAKALVTKWKAMVSAQDEEKVNKKKETAIADQTNICSDKKHKIENHREKEENLKHERSLLSKNKKTHQKLEEHSEKHKSKQTAKEHRHKKECEEREVNVEYKEKHGEHIAKQKSEDHKKDRGKIENKKKQSTTHDKTNNTSIQYKPSQSSGHLKRQKSQKLEMDEKLRTIKNDSSKINHDHNKSRCKSESSSKKRSNEFENITEGVSSSKKIKIEQKAHNEKTVTVDDGIDSSMGANFADVLGMLNNTGSSRKCKKTMTTTKSSYLINSKHSEAPSSSNIKIPSDIKTMVNSFVDKKLKIPDLLASANLEPLDPNIALELPTISNNYRPMPFNQIVMDCVFKNPSTIKTPSRTLTDAEALQHGISSKTMRTKIYSGNRTGTVHQVPSLFDLCIRMLQKNINGLEYTGGVPFDVLKNVLDRATPEQLYMFEEYNPYIIGDSDILWKEHVKRKYRTAKKQEMESWREMFLRCQEDEERRLNYLAEAIKLKEKKDAEPVRKTQLAFVDSLVKPPRNVARKQEQYGTRGKLIATPAARVTALSSVTPNAIRPGDVRLRVSAASRDPAQVFHVPTRAKKAPLMTKALQFMRGRHKR